MDKELNDIHWEQPKIKQYLSSWPTLNYADGKLCAEVYCDDHYVPWKAACSDHLPLSAVILDYSKQPPKRVQSKEVFENTSSLKLAIFKYLQKHQSMVPELDPDAIPRENEIFEEVTQND